MRSLRIALVLAGVLGLSVRAQVPLVRAHAHNDYEHARPLLDALDQGFTSVEADIWPVEGQLLVAHDREDVKPERTLEALYLSPLRERALSNGGKIFPGIEGFTLLVDIKKDAAGTYALLAPLLSRYRDLLTRFTDTNSTSGAVTVILSGDRPVDLVKSARERWCAIDGRLPDLEANPSRYLVPLVSDNWQRAFAGVGSGRLPAAESARLRTLVARAHEQGRRIRFWAVPDEDHAWRELFDAGVDLINTDRLVELRKFLIQASGAQ